MPVLPFDPDVSISIQFSGSYYGYAAGTASAQTITPDFVMVDVMTPISSDPSTWPEGNILTTLTPPPGEISFEPTGSTLDILVDVIDNQRRLSHLEIVDADTGTIEGTLQANDVGDRILGTVTVAATVFDHAINLYTRNPGLFGKGQTKKPLVNQAVVVDRIVGFEPNRGPDDPL
ncbi:MAG: hypothetical protein ABIN58_03170 [candidate division WOR-3 bacterium]